MTRWTWIDIIWTSILFIWCGIDIDPMTIAICDVFERWCWIRSLLSSYLSCYMKMAFWRQFHHWVHQKLSRCRQGRKFCQNDITTVSANAVSLKIMYIQRAVIATHYLLPLWWLYSIIVFIKSLQWCSWCPGFFIVVNCGFAKPLLKQWRAV